MISPGFLQKRPEEKGRTDRLYSGCTAVAGQPNMRVGEQVGMWGSALSGMQGPVAYIKARVSERLLPA